MAAGIAAYWLGIGDVVDRRHYHDLVAGCRSTTIKYLCQLALALQTGTATTLLKYLDLQPLAGVRDMIPGFSN